MTRIKLCGISKDEDAEYINGLKPDYVGFVFWEKSHRNITKETALRLRKILDNSITTVGVFVDEPLDNVISLYRDGIIGIAQLHGEESPEYIEQLQNEGIPVIKAFKAKDEETVKMAEGSSADYILFDTGKGTGITFNWELIKAVKRPYFLAGGLDTENVSQAIRMLNPYAVDVSSGIETDKLKDRNKMKLFVEKARKE